MAERRMFAKTIIDSDAFLDMPLSTQALYFHLSMRADDDGFINNPKKIQRMIGASDDDLKLLLAKRFLIPFESGIVVIKHWRIHNYIRSDRYKETVYQEEKAQLEVKENGAYTLPENTGIPVGIPNGYRLDTQDRIGKVSIGKDKDILSSSEQIKEIVDYLNEKCNTRYRANTDTTKKHINARLNEGFTVEDFKQVIDTKVAEWGKDSKMRKFLRPETLFGTKFESYLNQQIQTRREYGENGVTEW
jgi:uncharacterized phage protein (TIGR02220 family)